MESLWTRVEALGFGVHRTKVRRSAEIRRVLEPLRGAVAVLPATAAAVDNMHGEGTALPVQVAHGARILCDAVYAVTASAGQSITPGCSQLGGPMTTTTTTSSSTKAKVKDRTIISKQQP